MKIAVYGAGYVGLVTAACLAKMGHDVISADINPERIALLLQGECPIYEAMLPALLIEQCELGRLSFTTNLQDTIHDAQIHMIATGTPCLANGQADLSQVFAVAQCIAENIKQDGFVVIKSTVPVGTGDRIENIFSEIFNARKERFEVAVVSNPEFLREGNAVHDFLYADRIILGGEPDALLCLEQIYQPLTAEGIPVIKMQRRSAELTKYAANAMLASRISFMNQISWISTKVDADIEEVRKGLSADKRIGPAFLHAGIGYGGSCFPKDIQALMHTSKALDIDVTLLEAIDHINMRQKNWVAEQLMTHFKGALKDKRIGILGLAFKPGTDDMREASSLVVIERLLEMGSELFLYDPVAIPAAKTMFTEKSEKMSWCASIDEVLTHRLDALVIATEWPEFKNYPLALIRQSLEDAPLIDGRNCFDLEAVKAAKLSSYYSVGRIPLREVI